MINRYIGVGRLTRDPELRKTQTGKSVVNFSIAINKKSSQQDSQKEAEFINCIAWNKTAETIYQYCRKGMLVGVEGPLQTRKYQHSLYPEVTMNVTEVVVEVITFLSNKNDRADVVQSLTVPEGLKPTDSYFKDNEMYINSDDLPF